MSEGTRSCKHEHNGINFTFLGINRAIRASLLVARWRRCICLDERLDHHGQVTLATMVFTVGFFSSWIRMMRG